MGQFRQVKRRIKLQSSFPLINAVIADLQEGRIFENESKDLLYIIHKAGFSYLTKGDFDKYSELFNLFLTSVDIPGYFHIYDPSMKIISLCEESNDLVNIKVRKRLQLKYTSNLLPLEDTVLPKGYTIEKIDDLNFDSLATFNLNLESRFWKSRSDLINNGFGFFISNENNSPVSICYSACVVNNIAEIDVATLSGFQKMGLAKAVVNKFVQYCISNNIISNWDCFEDNLASVRTAKSIGFDFINSYTLLSIFNKSKNL